MAAPEEAEPTDAAVAATRVLRGLLTPARCRTFVRGEFAAKLPAICDKLLHKAAEGDLAALKTLLQMAALDKVDATEPGSGAPLTKQLAFVRKTARECRRDDSG